MSTLARWASTLNQKWFWFEPPYVNVIINIVSLNRKRFIFKIHFKNLRILVIKNTRASFPSFLLYHSNIFPWLPFVNFSRRAILLFLHIYVLHIELINIQKHQTKIADDGVVTWALTLGVDVNRIHHSIVATSYVQWLVNQHGNRHPVHKHGGRAERGPITTRSIIRLHMSVIEWI